MDETRSAIVAAVRRLDELGLNQNSSGNISVRIGDTLAVTPSGIPARSMVDGDVVIVDLDGRPTVDGQRLPTSEWRLHTEIVRRRPDVEAVVHTHSVEATAAATTGAPIPPIHYVAARFGTDGLRCAPYATYGTADLAVNVADTLGDTGMACLMANHGAIAVGASLDAALALAVDVEWFCSVARRAVDPVALPADEVARVARLFESYGQPD